MSIAYTGMKEFFSGVAMRLCELRQKEVINVCSCASMGCVVDVDIDPQNGQVLALIVPGPGRFSTLFGRDHECLIPWHCICQIGDEIILVELKEPHPPKR